MMDDFHERWLANNVINEFLVGVGLPHSGFQVHRVALYGILKDHRSDMPDTYIYHIEASYGSGYVLRLMVFAQSENFYHILMTVPNMIGFVGSMIRDAFSEHEKQWPHSIGL